MNFPYRRKHKLNFKKLYNKTIHKKNTDYSELKEITRTRKLSLLLKILVSANILILLLIIFLVYLNTENNRNFNNIIYKTDRLINNNNFREADSIIISSERYVNTKKNTLIFLKRYFTICDKLDNHVTFESSAEKYFKKYNNDKRIVKIYLFSLLKNNNIETFFNIFPFKSKKDPFYVNLLLEAYSKYLINKKDYKISSKLDEQLESNIYYSLLNDKNNLDKYISVYETDRNKYFLNNIALLLMEQGNSNDALKYSLLRNKKDYLQSLVYLDNLNFKNALSIISDIPDKKTDLKLVQSDIELNLNNNMNAELIYEDIMLSDPDFSNIPLINLIWLEYLNSGIINSDLLNKLSKNYETQNIKNLLFFINMHKTGLIQDNINDNFSDITNLLISNINNRTNYLDIIWRFFNKYNTDDNFKKYFLNYLLSAEKYEDLNILLKKEEIIQSNYQALFQFYLDIKYKKLNSAEKNIHNYLSNNKSWEIFYNIALLEINKKNYSEGDKYLNIILKNKYKLKNDDLSKIYFWKSYSNYHNGYYKESLRNINKSISSNRSNIEAKFLMNHIKSKIVES